MAPEVLNGLNYNEKADLWSIGVILFELLTGNPPFQAKSMKELHYKIDLGIYSVPHDVVLIDKEVLLLKQLL